MSADPQPSPFEPADEMRITNIEVLKVVFDARRMRILESFARQPRTVKEVSDELGVTPHSLYYHVNMLEEHGLLVVTETRMISGIMEKRYQMAARHFIIEPGLLSFGAEGDSAALDILLTSVLDETRIDVKRSARMGVLTLDRKAPDPQALLLRRGFTHMSPEQAHAFYQRLLDLVAEFATTEESEPHAEAQPLYALALAFYPTTVLGEESENQATNPPQ